MSICTAVDTSDSLGEFESRSLGRSQLFRKGWVGEVHPRIKEREERERISRALFVFQYKKSGFQHSFKADSG